jgi:hypothetical protein
MLIATIWSGVYAASFTLTLRNEQVIATKGMKNVYIGKAQSGKMQLQR